jgi:hypothetical protein
MGQVDQAVIQLSYPLGHGLGLGAVRVELEQVRNVALVL